MKIFSGAELDRLAFTLGGLGAGNICIKGTGALGSFCIRNAPGIYWDPMVFSAVTILGEKRIPHLEAPIPGMDITAHYAGSGYGLVGKPYGFLRFSRGEFSSRFPFADLRLADDRLPLEARIKAWSPFVPGNADKSYRIITTFYIAVYRCS